MEAVFQPEPYLAALVPIIAIVLGIGCGMQGMYLGYRKRKEMFALYHQERMAAIEKGSELPPLPTDFFYEDAARGEGARMMRRSPHRALLIGLILLFLGIALLIALHFNPSVRNGGDTAEHDSLWALLPISIGLAYLVYYFTVGRRLAAAMEEERKARIAAEAQEKLR